MNFQVTTLHHIQRPQDGKPHTFGVENVRTPLAGYRERDALPTISFGEYRNNYVKGDHALRFTGIALDVDKTSLQSAQAVGMAGSAALGGVGTLVYSSWSSTPEARRYRLAHIITRYLSPEEYQAVIVPCHEAYAIGGITVDPSGKDLARRFFMPHAGPYYEWACIDGPPLDVDLWLSLAKQRREVSIPRYVAPQRRNHYVARAVEGEIDALRTAGKGMRNSQANKAAFALARSELGLSAVEIQDALLPAAMAAGLSKGEATKAIQSGIQGRRGAA